MLLQYCLFTTKSSNFALKQSKNLLIKYQDHTSFIGSTLSLSDNALLVAIWLSVYTTPPILLTFAMCKFSGSPAIKIGLAGSTWKSFEFLFSIFHKIEKSLPVLNFWGSKSYQTHYFGNLAKSCLDQLPQNIDPN